MTPTEGHRRGIFEFINGKKNVARILLNNSVDLNWNLNASGVVSSLAADGGTVYAGGGGTGVKNTARSYMAIFEPSLFSSPAGVLVHPNLYRPSRGDTGLTIDRLPSNATVKIYTLRGQLVRVLDAGVFGILS